MSTTYRDYDVAMVTALLATVTTPTPPALPYYTAPVPGITLPVKVHSDLPEDWYDGYVLPGIAVLRVGEVPDATRMQPGFQGIDLLTDPVNTYEIASSRPQPINLLYQIQLAAQSMSDMNALLQHVLFRLPVIGYGATLPVYGTDIYFQYMGHHDLTDYSTKVGRILRRVVSYTVQGWMAETTTTLVKEILHVRATVDMDPEGTPLTSPPPPVDDPSDEVLIVADDPDA